MELTTYPINFTPSDCPEAFAVLIKRSSHGYQFATAGGVWWGRSLHARSCLGVMTDTIFRYDLGASAYCGEAAEGADAWAHVRSAVARDPHAG